MRGNYGRSDAKQAKASNNEVACLKHKRVEVTTEASRHTVLLYLSILLVICDS